MTFVSLQLIKQHAGEKGVEPVETGHISKMGGSVRSVWGV